MTREEAFMYIVIFTLSDIERNKKAEALYKNAIKKYDKLKTVHIQNSRSTLI